MAPWKTMEMVCQRTLRRSSVSESGTMSVPSIVMLPPTMRPGGVGIRSMPSPIVVLPQPDSPTTPRVSPGARLKLIPSTARTGPLLVR